MDSAKAAIRHDQHEIARVMFADDNVDDFIDRFRRSGVSFSRRLPWLATISCACGTSA